MVMVDEHREGETQSAESKIRPTMKLRSSLGAKKNPKKTKNHTNKSRGGSSWAGARVLDVIFTRASPPPPSIKSIPTYGQPLSGDI